jgi:hypothetical protein
MSYKGLVVAHSALYFFTSLKFYRYAKLCVCVRAQFMMLLVREFKLICVNKSVLTRYLSDYNHIVALVSIVQEQ